MYRCYGIRHYSKYYTTIVIPSKRIRTPFYKKGTDYYVAHARILI